MKYYGSREISLETIKIETREKMNNISNSKEKKKKRRKKRDNENELELEIIKKSNEIYENTQIQRERCLQIYTILRQNIQNSILSSYHNSGFFWEHYDDVSGKGTRGHPFSGWTSLIINIMAEI